MDVEAEIIAEFLVESHENLDQLDRDLVELEKDPTSRDLLSSIFRTIHTIKGTSGFLAFHRLEALTHGGENLLSRLRDGEMVMTAEVTEVLLSLVDTARALLGSVERTGSDTDGEADVDSVVAAMRAVLDAPAGAEPPRMPGEILVDRDVATGDDIAAALAEQGAEPDVDGTVRRGVVDSSVRVDVDLLDSLVQLVGELVLTCRQVHRRTEIQQDVGLLRAVRRLDLVASELQAGIMKTRMQPIGQVWSKMPRIVRDLAVQLGREVDLRMEGHETELDRSLLEALKGPLTHLVRNALDHGLEKPEDRVAAGKAAGGRLLLRAFQESGQVVVEVSDDGAGIDPEKIADAALQRGLVTREQAARMEPREIVDLVFRPGLSTAAEVTNVSGRGVGMDVVRTNIERIGGTVEIHSQVGQGTTCRVRIPLTLAIIPALVVGEAGKTCLIAQAASAAEDTRQGSQDTPQSAMDLAGVAARLEDLVGRFTV